MKTTLNTLTKTIDTNIKCNPRTVFIIISIIQIIVGILYTVMTLRITELPAALFWVLIIAIIIQFLYVWLWSFILKMMCKNKYNIIAWVFAIVSLLLFGMPGGFPAEYNPYLVNTSATTIKEQLITRNK